MEVEEKKLDLIRWLAGLDDLEILNQIGEIKKQNQQKMYEDMKRPYTEEELINSLEEAEADYQSKRIVSQDELAQKIKNGKIL